MKAFNYLIPTEIIFGEGKFLHYMLRLQNTEKRCYWYTAAML